MERSLYRALAFLVAAPALAWPAAPTVPSKVETDKNPVSVRVVKYDGLKDAVKQCRGKVLVVDVWSTT